MRNALLFSIAALGFVCLTQAGERGAGPPPGPLQQILANAKELNLTEGQRTKVEALSKEIGAGREGGAMREKLKDHPELAREMKEARDSGDQAKIKAAREKMREQLGVNAPGAAADGKPREILQKLQSIQTPEQMQKVREMREKNMQQGGGPRRGGRDSAPSSGEKNNKPDPSKGVPELFEN
jgi:Spy/CpxP family protein refolding chaperone